MGILLMVLTGYLQIPVAGTVYACGNPHCHQKLLAVGNFAGYEDVWLPDWKGLEFRVIASRKAQACA
jgi:hypothetical protein